MQKSKTAVIIGRFQPFHLGHVWLIKQALLKFPKIIIIIGSPYNKDENNIWSLEKRFEMIKAFIKKEKIKDRIEGIYKVEDVPDDDEWLNLMLKKIGKRDFVVLGDNEWVNGIFENAGYKTLRTGFFKRDIYEGTKIRKLIFENDKWEDRLPKYIVSLIKS